MRGKLQVLGKFISQGDVFGAPRLSIFVDYYDSVDMVFYVEYS